MQSKTVRTAYGETLTVKQQWAAQCEKRGTTVSSSAWEFTGAGGLSGETLTTPLASVNLSAQSSGTLKNTATLANGEVLIAYRQVEVEGACPPRDYA
jgi:hypothetical protein